MKCVGSQVTFAEVPKEVSLTLAISGCVNRCVGCHSPHLIKDIGEDVTREYLTNLVKGKHITCVTFLGGDQFLNELIPPSIYLKELNLKTALYSGAKEIDLKDFKSFDYVKTGNYIKDLGGLESPESNQKFYKNINNEWEDITYLFHKGYM